MSAAEVGRAVLARDAVPEVLALADVLVKHEEAEWIYDPEVSGVVGLVRPGTRKAFIVIYVDADDHEISDEFGNMLYA